MSDKIEARDVRFRIAETPTRHWLKNDPAMTWMVDSFAVFLPEGERYFIRALKFYAPRVKDPQLLDDLDGFSRQEAFHSREHEGYNAALAALGYDVPDMERRVKARLDRAQGNIKRVIVTCSIEHLTSTFSSIVLNSPELFEDAAEPYRRLWMWHALEELEHRSVALKMLPLATPKLNRVQRYFFRVIAMNRVLSIILGLWFANIASCARTDGVKPGFRLFMDCFWKACVYPGFLRRGFLYFIRYYMPGYDPEKSHSQAFIEKWRRRVEDDLNAQPTAQTGTA